jgi:hypothetical protein
VFGSSLDSIDMPTRIFQEEPFTQYTAAVELYTRRSLTEPSDILNAFEGVAGVLQSHMDTSMHFGLPLGLLDSALLWESLQLLRRREGFPSWSWAGWVGEIQWNFPENVGNAQSWIDWHFVDCRNCSAAAKQKQIRIPPPMPFEAIAPAAFSNQSPDRPHALRFTSISIFLKLTAPSTSVKDEISPLRRRRSGPSTLSTTRPAPLDPHLMRTGLSDLNNAWCGSILLDESWKDRIGTIVELVVLSSLDRFTPKETSAWQDYLPDDETIMPVYNVLMIARHDPTVSRVSIGRVLQTSLKSSYAPGPVWKEFLLE